MLRQAITIARRDVQQRWLRDLLWLLGGVVLVIVIGNAVGTLIKRSYTPLFASGMIAYMIAMAGLSTGIDLLIDRKGFVKLLLVAPVSRETIILGKLFSLLISTLKNYVIMAWVLLWYVGSFLLYRALLILLIACMTGALFLGMGFFFSAFLSNPRQAENLMQYVAFFTLFLSGAVYPISSLPLLFFANPLTYAVEALRFAMGSQPIIPPAVSFSVLAVLSLSSLLFGALVSEWKLRG